MDTLIAGVGTGCVYALLALGFGVIAYVSGIANFAQGSVAMVAAYALFSSTEHGLGMGWGVVAALIAGGVTAVIVQLAAALPARHREHGQTWLLAVIGMSIAIEGLAGALFGFEPRSAIILPGASGSHQIGHIQIPSVYIVLACTLICAVVLVEVVFSPVHRFGRAARAVAGDPMAARLVGVRSWWTTTVAWLIGGALGGVAGVLAAPVLQLSPGMGTNVGLLAVIAAIVGGLGRIGAAPVLGGLILGVIEAAASRWAGGQWSTIVAVGVLAMLMLIRPDGLMPKARARRV
jgi:branched-chain amino acid transport system permease protein